MSLVLRFFGIAVAQEVHETAVDQLNDANTERTMDQGRREQAGSRLDARPVVRQPEYSLAAKPQVAYQ